VNTLY